MKTRIVLTIVGAALSVGVLNSLAADDLPKPQAFARYDAMLNRSPFAVASAPAAAPAATPNFAKDLYVANLARTADADLVTIASSTDKSFKKYLTSKQPVDGYGVNVLEWSERIGASTVTITKDGQSATLTFNQAVLSQPPAPGMQVPPQQQAPIPQPQAAQPQMQNGAAAVPIAVPNQAGNPPMKAAPIPTLPTPPPRMRGVIQRKPEVDPGQAAPQSQPDSE